MSLKLPAELLFRQIATSASHRRIIMERVNGMWTKDHDLTQNGNAIHMAGDRLARRSVVEVLPGSVLRSPALVAVSATTVFHIPCSRERILSRETADVNHRKLTTPL